MEFLNDMWGADPGLVIMLVVVVAMTFYSGWRFIKLFFPGGG